MDIRSIIKLYTRCRDRMSRKEPIWDTAFDGRRESFEATAVTKILSSNNAHESKLYDLK